LFFETYPILLNTTKKIVCIAVRLTDYKTWEIDEINKNTPELNFNYFKTAISKIQDLENKIVILISDDLNSARQNISLKNPLLIERDIFQIIALTVSHELVISNSTFHWWGAWLNQKKDKKVYAPKYWLGHKVNREYPKNIIPKDWIQIDV
jgi:hypothetical protein